VRNPSVDILVDTDHFVALSKPSGMLSIPDRENKEPSLKFMLEQAYGKIFTVHRLDRDTSGVIIFAKDEATHQYLSKLFEGRQVQKQYLGFVHGQPISPSGHMDGAIMEHPLKKGTMMIHAKGKASSTDYRVLESFGILSLVEFDIHTGRTHQIRVHSKDLGNPIAVDPLYGDGQPILLSSIKRKFKLSKNEEEERPILNRLALHAFSLKFTDPDGKIWEIEAPMPKDMSALLQQLRKWKSK
jgi:23S rRNA pseudouridine1911/1915/1917 synthase